MGVLRLTDVIPPAFYDVHKDVLNNGHYTYRLKGGRGSGKSSYIASEVIYLMMKFPFACAVVFMKHQNRLRKGVINLYMQCIKRMGVEKYFKLNLSSFTLTYLPTGQYILFLGLDDAYKTKGLSVSDPDMYFAITHFEELDQFYGMSEIDTALESTGRGGDIGWNFECFNPPENKFNWVNEDSELDIDNRLVHHSDYRSMPKDWLGKIFIDKAEQLKYEDEQAYNHRYLGIPTGCSGAVFNNIEYRSISDEEIENFDFLFQGADWGWYPDPYVFVRLHYERSLNTIYIIDEIVGNRQPIEYYSKEILNRGYNNIKTVIDSAKPEDYYRYRQCGIWAENAVKGAGSIDLGLEWLQRRKFVVDENRTPFTCKELREYEYEKDKFGSPTGEYMAFNNHSIDAIRYAMLDYIRKYGDIETG